VIDNILDVVNEDDNNDNKEIFSLTRSVTIRLLSCYS
jgi:hypothetical protein